MNKKAKETLTSLLCGASVILAIYLWYKLQVGGAAGFFIFIIVAYAIPLIIMNLLIPNKEPRKKNAHTSKKKRPPSQNPQNVKPLNQLLTYNLKELSGYDFEKLCYEYLKTQYKHVEHTSTMFITTTGYTQSARETAERHHM